MLPFNKSMTSLLIGRGQLVFFDLIVQFSTFNYKSVDPSYFLTINNVAAPSERVGSTWPPFPKSPTIFFMAVLFSKFILPNAVETYLHQLLI